MTREFTHLEGSDPDYFGYGREVFEQISSEFPYETWEEGAKLTLMSVPWGVYNAQFMTDRPAFDTVVERDKWFNAHIANAKNNTESHVLDTLVRYQFKDYADLPFTFDYTSLYNYLIVEYKNAPVTSGAKGIRKFFFHITDIDYLSPSTTRVKLVPDWWVTVAPLLDISHMILERGHAPLSETNTDKFLTNPIANSAYLLAPDVNYGTNEIVATQHNDVINSGTIYAVICTKNIQLTSAGASHYDSLPAGTNFVDGLPSDYQIAINAEKLLTFLNNWKSQAPQTMQALSAIYLVSAKLINIGSAFTLFGVEAHYMSSNTYLSKTIITKDMFNYPKRVQHLAKLYTSPYAHIEVADGSGNVTTINVEDLSTNNISVECALNGAFPWLNISTHILNNGGAQQTISFKTTEARNFIAGGKWYETLKSWNVPCFSVYQSNAQTYDYRTHYSRVQQKNNADTAYANALASNATANTNALESNATSNTNALASNSTANTNALASNATAKTNADNSANTAVSNTAVAVAASTATTARTIEANNDTNYEQTTKLASDWDADFATSSASYEAGQAAIGLAATNNQANGLASTISQAVGTVGAAATGNIGGALSGLAGMVSTGVQIEGAQASYALSQSNNSSLYAAATEASETKRSAASNYSIRATGYSNSAMSDNTATNNNANTATTANSASLIKTNASNTKTTGDANANRTKATADANANRSKATADANTNRTKATADANALRNRDNSYTAITNAINEAGLQAPIEFGARSNGEFASTRPQVLSVNIITQSESAISQAATQFLRYGYALNQAYEFATWKCMKNFTYWKVSDIWATGVDTVPEEGQDAVRQMLYSGVTCWSDPDKIGKVSIYDN